MSSHEAKRASRYLGRAAGSLLGLAGGLYGTAAGFLLGAMVDEMRAESDLRRFLKKPDGTLPREALPGLAAALAIAARGPWTEGLSWEERIKTLRSAVELSLGLGRAEQAWAERVAEAARGVEALDLASLARCLATRGSPQSRAFLAELAYGLRKRRGEELVHGEELGIRAALADSGLSPSSLLAARKAYFPAYRDPWEVLALAPGASLAEIKTAYRRLSKERHPDIAAADHSEAKSAALFRELREAYLALAEQG